MTLKSKSIALLFLPVVAFAQSPLNPKEQALEEVRKEIESFYHDQHDYKTEIDLMFEQEISTARERTKKYFDGYLSLLSEDDASQRKTMFKRLKGLNKFLPKINEKAKVILKLQYLSFENAFHKKKKENTRGLLESINYGELIASEYPDFGLLDRSLYLTGHTYAHLRQHKKAGRKFHRIVKEFPKSPYFIAANLRLGDAYFEGEQYLRALPYYKIVKAWGPKKYRYNVTNKMGWIYLKKGQTFLAADEFLQYGEKDKMLSLVGRMFAEQGGFKSAQKYFSVRTDKTHTYAVYGMIADHLSLKKKYAKANHIYRTMITAHPDHYGNLDSHKKLLANMKNLKLTERYYNEISRFLDLYHVRSEWYGAQNAYPTIQKEAKEASAQLRYERVRFLHDYARETKRSIDYLRASAAYRDFIQNYPDTFLLEEANFNYAQTLYFARKFSWAAEEYEFVVDNSSNQKFIGSSMLGMIKAYEHYLRKKRRLSASREVLPLVDKHGQALPPRTLIDEEEHLLRTLGRFSKFSMIPFVKPVLHYKKGTTFFQNNYFSKARNNFFKVLSSKTAKRQMKLDSISHIVSSYRLENNWAEVENWTGRLIRFKKSSSRRDLASLYGLRSTALFRKAEMLEEREFFDAAIREYNKLVQRNPTSRHAPLALYNAAVLSEKQGRLREAIAGLNKINVDYSQSEIVPQTLLLRANLYNSIFDEKRAAISYQQLVRRRGSASEISEALYRLGSLSKAQGDYKAAGRYFRRFARRKGKKRAARTAYLESIQAYRDGGLLKKAARVEKEYLKKYPNDYNRRLLFTALRYLEVEERLPQEATPILRELRKLQKRYKGHSLRVETREALAEVELRKMKSLNKKYVAIRLAYPEETLRKQEKLRQKILKSMVTQSKRLRKYKVARASMQSALLLGDATQDARLQYVRLGAPPAMTAEERNAFDETQRKRLTELENKIDTYYERALSAATAGRLTESENNLVKEKLYFLRKDIVFEPVTWNDDPLQAGLNYVVLPEEL